MNYPIDLEYEVMRKGPLQEFGPNLHRRFSRRGIHENSHGNPREDSACSFCFNNNNDNFVYKNKINFCAGYFPDYILYPCVDIDKVEPDLRLFLNYYPTFSEGKYSKQTFNEFSKYNKQYLQTNILIYLIIKVLKLIKLQPKVIVINLVMTLIKILKIREMG